MPKKKPSFKTPLFYQNRILSSFFGQLEYQNKILQRIQGGLPKTLAKHTLHSLIKDNRLLIYTDAAVWATQLRFYNKVLLDSIAPFSSTAIESVQIKIITEQTGLISQPAQKVVIPSIETIEGIRNGSLSVSDKQLKLALQKLSSTLKRLSADSKRP